MVRIRYCLSARSAPSRGTVSTVISASICAHSGCMLAMTPSRANRSISASSTSCACAMTGRRSRGPLESATYSIASSAWRTAASPIAWMWICRPRSSTRRAASASDRPSHTCMPWLCSEEQYGASSAPVSFSTTPSAKNFTVRAVSRSDPSSSTRLRASAKWADLRVEVPGVGVEAEVEPDAQRAPPGGLDVGVDVARLDPGVLHPGHSPRQVVVGRRPKRRHPHVLIALRHDGRHQVDRAPFAQRPEHRAVLAARDLAEHRVRGVRGDAGTVEGNRVAPGGVVIPRPQHHRTVRDGGVEPTRVEQPVRGEAAVVGGPDDPLVVGVFVGELSDGIDDFVDRGARPHRRSDRFQPAQQRMGMTVAERGHQESAVEVDLLDIAASEAARRAGSPSASMTPSTTSTASVV